MSPSSGVLLPELGLFKQKGVKSVLSKPDVFLQINLTESAQIMHRQAGRIRGILQTAAGREKDRQDIDVPGAQIMRIYVERAMLLAVKINRQEALFNKLREPVEKRLSL
ncbi:MAG: hypothetical protein KTR20_03145 [Cellvibrionaceae bacterium]|nr:hypothetical protein [Cellvibrionaceae bacterium]